MGFDTVIKDAIAILKLDTKTIKKVSNDKEAWKWGFLIVAIGSWLGSIANYFNPQPFAWTDLGLEAQAPSLVGVITSPIGAIIGTIIGVGLIFLIAKLFRGKGKFINLLGPGCYLSLLTWLGVLSTIPFFGGAISLIVFIWAIVVWFTVIKTVHSLSTAKAVIVLLIPLAVFFFIALAVAAFLVATVGSALL